MRLKEFFWPAVGIVLGAVLANASPITFTCASGVAASTCNYLNTTVADLYSSTFTNASANIYIKYGTTGLASTSQFNNDVTYNQYVDALEANVSKDGLQISALSALNTYDAGPYGGGNVNITDALGTALGLGGDVPGGLTGETSTGAACNFPSAGCYNAVITVTNDPSTPLYYDNLGGPEPADAYDFYATVEHETDEVLGVSSCIGTGPPLSNGCDFPGEPSAVDLFRYSSAGHLVLDSSLSTTPGAYFSYDGGVTNGAKGSGGSSKFYNTLANGDDYADFISSSPDCSTNQAVQDAEGCPGEDKGLNILNDGGAELNLLNAVGYDEKTTAATPEPSMFATMALFGFGIAFFDWYRRRRRA